MIISFSIWLTLFDPRAARLSPCLERESPFDWAGLRKGLRRAKGNRPFVQRLYFYTVISNERHQSNGHTVIGRTTHSSFAGGSNLQMVNYIQEQRGAPKRAAVAHNTSTEIKNSTYDDHHTRDSMQ